MKKFNRTFIEGIKIINNAILMGGQSFAIGDNEEPHECIIRNLENRAQVNTFKRYVELNYKSMRLFNHYLREHEGSNSIEYNLVFRDKDLGIECFKLDYPGENKQVTLISTSEDKYFESNILKYMRYKCKDLRISSLSDSTAKREIINLINGGAYLKKIDEIPTISNEADEYCLCYIPLKKITDQVKDDETPAWDNFLSQFAEPDMARIFQAFVYSVVYAKNKGRQLLWLQGPGKTGKSVVTSVIYQYVNSFGKSIATTLASYSKFDQFTYENFEGCRLVVIPDTRERNLVRREEILRLTGNDFVTIRKMYQAKATKRIYSKIIAVSNFHPYINFANVHETSRLIYTALEQDKCNNAFNHWVRNYPHVNFEKKLLEEMPAFLKKCEKHYFDLIGKDGDFTITTALLAAIKAISYSNLDRAILAFINYYLEPAPGHQVPLDKLARCFSKFFGKKGNAYIHFLQEALKNKKIKVFEKNVNGVIVKYVNDYILAEEDIMPLEELIETDRIFDTRPWMLES